jgi:hypothetical protein
VGHGRQGPGLALGCLIVALRSNFRYLGCRRPAVLLA